MLPDRTRCLITPQSVTMARELSPQEKLDLITSQLQEVLKPEILEDVILKQNRPLVIYWGE